MFFVHTHTFMKGQVVDVVESGREIVVFLRDAGGAPHTVRVQGTPFRIQVQLADFWTDDRAQTLGSKLNEALLFRNKYRLERNCPRTNCACGESGTDHRGMSAPCLAFRSMKLTESKGTQPCRRIQLEDREAVTGARIILRKSLVGYMEEPCQFVEFDLAASYYAAPAEKWLYEFLQISQWTECEVFSTLKDGVMGFLYASVERDRTATASDGATGIGSGTWIQVPGPVVHFSEIEILKDEIGFAPHKLLSFDLETQGPSLLSQRLDTDVPLKAFSRTQTDASSASRTSAGPSLLQVRSSLALDKH